MNRSIQKLLLTLVPMAIVGCGSSVEKGMVSGTVTSEGKPLEQVMVYFMPDPVRQTEGAHSTAITDKQGRYELIYYGDTRGPGAVVGWHRVTLEDMVPENYRGGGAPPESRVPESLSEAWQTPLSYEIKAGEQEINIDVANVSPEQ